MSNLERSMKEVAAALTGRGADEIPDHLEDICSFIAENYSGGESYSLPMATEQAIGGVKKAAAVSFTTDSATAETCATALEQLISNLKTAGIMA